MQITMTWFRGLNWFWIAAGLVLGGIVHITTILALPYLASSSAWARLENATPINTLQILPPASPEVQLLPLMAPDVRYALCRYNVTDGPVIVRARLLDRSWSIALYTPHSLNFYAISGADLQRVNVTMIITQTAESEVTKIPLSKGARSSAITVAVPEPEGLLLLRAPLRSTAYLPMTESAFTEMSCGLAER